MTMSVRRVRQQIWLFGIVLLGAAGSRIALADPGELAIISFASDNPDALAFVVLREIPASTEIRFTDSGWLAGGGFRANEGGIEYTAASVLSPGTVISRSDPFTSGGWAVNNAGVGGGGFSLSTSGDQILAFTGSAGSPAFVHAVDFDGSGYSDAVSSNTTGLPPGLVVGDTAVDLSETDNGYYNGPTSGTASDLLVEIGDPANWTTSDGALTPPAWDFTVVEDGLLLQSVSVVGSTFSVGQTATVVVSLSGAPDPGSPVTVVLSSGALTSDAELIISDPNASGAVDVTMANPGNWTILATAAVGASGQAESAAFSVGTSQNPPVADAGTDRTVALSGATVTVALAGATASDPDGLAGASYAWTPATAAGLVGWQNRSGAVAAATDPGQAEVTFDAAGAYVLTLTVTDADGLMDSDTTVVTVSNPNPPDEFDPPPGYYDAATGQGGTLKAQLTQIITSGHVQQSYGDFRYSAARYDADPAVPGNILLAYNRASVSGTWNSGATWNREHVWPQSRQPGSAGNGSTGNLGDPFALRPIDPGVNSSRGNSPFGAFHSTGGFGAVGAAYFPGDADKGDIARSLMYSATRYAGTLSLVSGTPSGNQMGDLDALVRWNYTDVPDFFERRRGQLIFEDQGNRNPFIDHPEFVWSIFGDGANDSTLYISATEPADGASYIPLVLDPIVVGGPLPGPESVTLSKAGADPTYYAVTALDDAVSDVTGRFNAFDFGSQQRVLSVGLAVPPDTIGGFGGFVIIDNLDISSEGIGQGADDGEDIIDLSLTVYDHAQASFDSVADENTLTIDFGTVPADTGLHTLGYALHNLASATGFTAALDLDSVGVSGDSGRFVTDAAPFAGLAGGASTAFLVGFDSDLAAAGPYAASFTFEVSDEDLPGAIAGDSLTLTVTALVAGAIFPFDDDGDGDIDGQDAANFLACLAGPDASLPSPDCDNHDWDEDGDVDLADAAALQVLFTGLLP